MLEEVDEFDLKGFYGGHSEASDEDSVQDGEYGTSDKEQDECDAEELSADGSEHTDDGDEEFDLSTLLVGKKRQLPEGTTTKTAQKKRMVEPEVIEFMDPTSGGGFNRISGGRRFLSSSIKKLNAPTPSASMSSAARKQLLDSIGEQENEKVLDKKLRELTEMHLERVAAEGLSGIDRKRYMLSKMDQLGLKASSTAPKQKSRTGDKPRVPMKIATGMMDVSKKRADRARQEAGEEFLVSSTVTRTVGVSLKKKKGGAVDHVFTSSSHPLLKQKSEQMMNEDMAKKVFGHRRQERGLKVGIGKYKDGQLHIRKWGIEKVSGGDAARKRGDFKGKKGGKFGKRKPGKKR